MMKAIRIGAIAVLLLIGAALCFLSVADSSSYHECVRKAEQQPSSQPQNERPNQVFMTRVVIRCLGDFVDKNNAAVTALSTVVIAIFTTILGVFTVSLAKSTRIAALAANRTAETAVALELPHIRVDRPRELLKTDSAEDNDGGLVWDTEFPELPQFSRIYDISFRNIGRSTASPTALLLGWQVTNHLRGDPQFCWSQECRHQSVIPADKEATISFDSFGIELTDQQRLAVKNKEAALWLYGRLEYEDFMDEPHFIGFCWRWGCPDGVGLYYFYVDEKTPQQYRAKG
jgi:hypothetical protein